MAIWIGDINAATDRSKTMSNDKKFAKFCVENHLKFSSHMPTKPTFHHSNVSGGILRIDFFIQRNCKEQIANINIWQREALNVSSHDPLSAVIATDLAGVPTSTQPQKKPPGRVRWDKVDRVTYRETTEV